MSWRYGLEPVDGGTRVVESYEVVRPVTRVGWSIIERFGGGHRRSELRRGMETTLERLRTAVEHPAPSA